MSSSIDRPYHKEAYDGWKVEGGSECCIYRVPKRIRKANEEAYTPQVISIGPFHYGKKELEDMEKKKRSYVREFFKRTTREKYDEVFAFIKEHEQQIRNCYAETCMLESDKYVTMILCDAIFIIELLLRNFEEDERDFLLVIPAEKLALRLDLQLLENQLPYFLLERLYKLLVSNPSFIDLCFKFFEDQMFDSVSNQTEPKHFTDLQRSALVKSYPKQMFDHVYSGVDLPGAEMLYLSGVKFKVVHETDRCLLDIRFEEGKLRIPQLSVDNATETILGNIMALEQCYYRDDTPVSDYVELLDSLINTKRDVDLLVRENVISNLMGEKTALVSLFSKLCSHMPINKRYYCKIQEALKAHYDAPWNRIRANLKIVYFVDPWRANSTIATVISIIIAYLGVLISLEQLNKQM